MIFELLEITRRFEALVEAELLVADTIGMSSLSACAMSWRSNGSVWRRGKSKRRNA